MNCSRFCFFNSDGDRGERCEFLFAEFPSAVLGELSSLCPREGELGECPWMAFCALPSRRESFFFLDDNWAEEEDDDES